MRRTLITLAALLLAGAAGLGITHIIVSGGKDKVTFEENVITGDRSALNGLNITLYTSLHDKAEWQSTLSFTSGQVESSTECIVPPVSAGRDFGQQGDVKLAIQDSSCSTLNGKRVLPPDVLRKYEAIEKELAESSVSGQTVEKKVAVKDLYEYYPLTFSIDLPDRQIGSSFSYASDYKEDSIEGYALRKLEDYFKVPVLEDEYRTIGYTRPVSDGTGSNRVEITHTEEVSEDESDFYLLNNYQSYLSTDEAIYFWFRNETSNGNRADMSMIKGGYGIYELPYGYVDDPDYLGYGKFKGYDVFVDRLNNIFPVDENDTILGAVLSEDRSELIVLLGEGQSITASIIDRATHELKQYLVLEENVAEDLYCYLLSADGIVLYNTDAFAYGSLVKNAAGTYEKGFTIDLLEGRHSFSRSMEEEQKSSIAVQMSRYTPEIFYDGSRIVFCMAGGTEDNESFGYCGVEVYVFTSAGLQYHGIWDSSLNDANYAAVEKSLQGYVFDGSKSVSPFYCSPLKITSSVR